MSENELVRAENLDLTAAEVRRRWPHAVEYVGLDGEPCWFRSDLTDAVSEGSDA